MDRQPKTDDRNCPSCGRFVGPYEICPHCQASMENRVKLKTLKLVAVFGAIIGLALLWTGVRLREIPTVQIGTINLQYNMALVKIKGTVLDISIDEIKDTFRLTVDDDTGRISLNGYGKYTKFKKDLGDSFPMTGDIVEAVGNLSVSESWGITMFMSSPRRLTLVKRQQQIPLDIGTINRKSIGRKGHFTARITNIRTFKSGRVFTIENETGSIDLTVFETEIATMDAAKQSALEKPGNTITFFGRVDAFRNKLQLRLVKPDLPENFVIESNS